jgi:hypothetical protein
MGAEHLLVIAWRWGICRIFTGEHTSIGMLYIPDTQLGRLRVPHK